MELGGQHSHLITLLTEEDKGVRGRGMDYAAAEEVEEVASSSAANKSQLSNAVEGVEFRRGGGGNHGKFSCPRGR